MSNKCQKIFVMTVKLNLPILVILFSAKFNCFNLLSDDKFYKNKNNKYIPGSIYYEMKV